MGFAVSPGRQSPVGTSFTLHSIEVNQCLRRVGRRTGLRERPRLPSLPALWPVPASSEPGTVVPAPPAPAPVPAPAVGAVVAVLEGGAASVAPPTPALPPNAVAHVSKSASCVRDRHTASGVSPCESPRRMLKAAVRRNDVERHLTPVNRPGCEQHAWARTRVGATAHGATHHTIRFDRRPDLMFSAPCRCLPL